MTLLTSYNEIVLLRSSVAITFLQVAKNGSHSASRSSYSPGRTDESKSEKCSSDLSVQTQTTPGLRVNLAIVSRSHPDIVS